VTSRDDSFACCGLLTNDNTCAVFAIGSSGSGRPACIQRHSQQQFIPGTGLQVTCTVLQTGVVVLCGRSSHSGRLTADWVCLCDGVAACAAAAGCLVCHRRAYAWNAATMWHTSARAASCCATLIRRSDGACAIRRFRGKTTGVFWAWDVCARGAEDCTQKLSLAGCSSTL
jgi:hypothetical protein